MVFREGLGARLTREGWEEPEPSWDAGPSRLCGKLWTMTFVGKTCHLQCSVPSGNL